MSVSMFEYCSQGTYIVQSSVISICIISCIHKVYRSVKKSKGYCYLILINTNDNIIEKRTPRWGITPSANQ